MDARTLKRQYALRFEQHEQHRQDVWKILCRRFFSRYVTRESAVLDVGAGWGEFINNIEVAEKYAMDLNPETGARVASEVRYLQQDCSREWRLPAASLDVVFTSNFLEHLPDKASVQRTVLEARRCLKPAGRLICLGPNVRCLPGAYWDFWDHHVPLSEASLSELLQICGFRVEICLGRFLPYSMSKGFTPPLFLLRLYLTVPIAWRVLGKQFLVIAQKMPAE